MAAYSLSPGASWPYTLVLVGLGLIAFVVDVVIRRWRPEILANRSGRMALALGEMIPAYGLGTWSAHSLATPDSTGPSVGLAGVLLLAGFILWGRLRPRRPA